jgi:guanine deaminase
MNLPPKENTASLETRFASARVVRRRHFLTAGAAALAATYAGSDAFARAAKATAPAADAVTDQDRQHMSQAIELMRKAGVVDKTGGPFGAVVVMKGEVLSSSGNSVLKDNDPSAHAEVNAIRLACKKTGSPHINGATLFSSCEPCPMCYSTAYWARVGKIYYAAAWTDYADLFDDLYINDDMKRPYAKRTVHVEQLMRGEARKVWLEYRKMSDRTRY